MWTYCLMRLGAARASAYIYLVPVVTVIAASLWLNEKPGPWAVLGIVLTILGLLLSEYRHKQG
ncbi:MAG: DMT family transporter [Desulfovibrio sp.]|nr:DMT family transporter [Desulfovibrio sp.]